MLKIIFDYLTRPSPLIQNEVEQQRARLLSTILIPLIIMAPIGSFVSTIEDEKISVAVLFVISVIAYGFSRTPYFKIAGIVITIALFIPPYITLFNLETFTQFTMLANTSWMNLPILLGSIWLPIRQVITIWILNLLFLSIVIVLFLPNLPYQLALTSLVQLIVFGSIILLATRLRNDDTDKLLLQSEELKSAKHDAEQSNMAKSVFLSQMSHELRTPLNAILGFSQLLQLSKNMTPKQLDSVNEINKGGTHLLNLVNEVLDLAKIEAGNYEINQVRINPTEILKECISLTAPMLSQLNISLTTHIDEDLSDICADKTRLKQIIFNLISNACKYNRENGSIEIKSNNTNDDKVRISIKDSGIGITEDQYTGIFEAFNRLDSNTHIIEGSGIGLSISKQLIEQMNGSISFKSKPDEGSTFWVELPQLH